MQARIREDPGTVGEGAATKGYLDQARSRYEAGEFRECREAALAGLAGDPEDVALLRLAGRAGVELGLPEAVGELRRVVELLPDDAQAWSEFGDALVAEGQPREATNAFQRALDLNPDDEAALTNLGHIAASTGDSEDAIGYLAQAAERGPGNSTAAISLVEMYRSVGQPEQALATAIGIAEAQPDDVLAALDVAELSLSLGHLDEAIQAFERLREVDDIPDHDVYALYGMIEVALQRADLGRARELAGEAAHVDPHGRTKDVLAFLEGHSDDSRQEPASTRADVDQALDRARAEHRRLHVEDRRLTAEDLG
jgi:tetratricopeptide (TPR) repeat protein